MTGPAHARDEERRFWRTVWIATAATLLGLVALEGTSIDLTLARLSYDPLLRNFPLREHFLTSRVSHDGVKIASALVFAWILASMWRPIGLLSRLDRVRRVYLFIAAAACLVVVASLKRGSALHCPWGLLEFGGSHAYLRLFETIPDGWQRGSCFPAGHALSALAYIGGYFAWRDVDRRIARTWLTIVLVAGAWAGVSQQLRGAHFLSHTLWSAWLTWTLSAAIAWLARPRLRPVSRAGPAAG
ncbi:MAG TPA: phosphatase PAP2 family protein [Burkholderiaceae bacterium]|nr:phosphatase PAP2 family protein [Burkholderiaceae bacterium]